MMQLMHLTAEQRQEIKQQLEELEERLQTTGDQGQPVQLDEPSRCSEVSSVWLEASDDCPGHRPARRQTHLEPPRPADRAPPLLEHLLGHVPSENPILSE